MKLVYESSYSCRSFRSVIRIRETDYLGNQGRRIFLLLLIGTFKTLNNVNNNNHKRKHKAKLVKHKYTLSYHHRFFCTQPHAPLGHHQRTKSRHPLPDTRRHRQNGMTPGGIRTSLEWGLLLQQSCQSSKLMKKPTHTSMIINNKYIFITQKL